MTAHSRSHTPIYVGVFAALLVLTGVTVGVSYLHLAAFLAVAVAMIIAATKGSLVAAYFMHLIGEKKIIYFVLILTAFFLLFLLFVPWIVSMGDYRVS